MEIISLIIIGLSLSIDAFTLSLTYGILNIPKKTIFLTSILVGICHFIMPLLGHNLGDLISCIININSKYILITVLLIILIETCKSLKEEETEHNLNIINMLLFAILVSFDSFSLGIGIIYITHKIILASTIFSILSCIFTMLGFILGKIVGTDLGKKAKILGIIMLSLLIMYFLCQK